MATSFERDGYLTAPGVLSRDVATALAAAIEHRFRVSADRVATSQRNVLAISEVYAAATSDLILNVVESAVGAPAKPVRGILFDKSAEANWGVGWHQDQVIAVAQRRDAPGFMAWSVKQGVVHVKPPAEILQQMVTVRLSLDDCPASNGALQVLPGSHRHGLLASDQVRRLQDEQEAVTCANRLGDALLMRPLVLHASARATRPTRRRVLHLEYATASLPHGLQWPDWRRS